MNTVYRSIQFIVKSYTFLYFPIQRRVKSFNGFLFSLLSADEKYSRRKQAGQIYLDILQIEEKEVRHLEQTAKIYEFAMA